MQFDPHDLIVQTASAPTGPLVPVEQGLSDSLKFKTEMNGRLWMVKITCGNQKRVLWYEELSKMKGNGLSVPEYIHLFDGKTLCLLAPWVEGVNLEESLKKAGSDEVRRYAVQVAHLIRKLHEKRFPAVLYGDQLARRVERVCQEVERYDLTFPHAKECVCYLRQTAQKHICGGLCIVHRDVRPENFILQDGWPHLIDFENGGLGEPAADFTYLITMGPEEQRPFARHMIECYLDGKDAGSFWCDNLLYSTLQVAEYAIWKYKTRNKQVFHQAENLWQQYDGFNSFLPAWWRAGE